MHRLPDLPWALDALEPQISAKTLALHHGKHHAAYVAKLNELIKGTRSGHSREAPYRFLEGKTRNF